MHARNVNYVLCLCKPVVCICGKEIGLNTRGYMFEHGHFVDDRGRNVRSAFYNSKLVECPGKKVWNDRVRAIVLGGHDASRPRWDVIDTRGTPEIREITPDGRVVVVAPARARGNSIVYSYYGKEAALAAAERLNAREVQPPKARERGWGMPIRESERLERQRVAAQRFVARRAK